MENSLKWFGYTVTLKCMVVTWRTRLNGSTIPMQGPTPDAQLAAMGLNGLASSVRP